MFAMYYNLGRTEIIRQFQNSHGNKINLHLLTMTPNELVAQYRLFSRAATLFIHRKCEYLSQPCGCHKPVHAYCQCEYLLFLVFSFSSPLLFSNAVKIPAFTSPPSCLMSLLPANQPSDKLGLWTRTRLYMFSKCNLLLYLQKGEEHQTFNKEVVLWFISVSADGIVVVITATQQEVPGLDSRGLSECSVHVLPVPARVFSGYSSFLPQCKNMHVRHSRALKCSRVEQCVVWAYLRKTDLWVVIKTIESILSVEFNIVHFEGKNI